MQGAETDPVHAFPFTVSTIDAVVTACSCFAQHISRRLAASGYKFLVTEPAHSFLEPDTAEAFNYGRFTAPTETNTPSASCFSCSIGSVAP